MKLTEKQKRFVDEYLIDLNATQAAIRAGYSSKTANEQGNRLLANVSIADEISKAMADRSKRTGISQDRVLAELAHIAFDDIKNYLNFRTEKVPVGVEDGNIIIDYRTIVDVKDSRTIDTRNISEISIGKDGQFKFKLYCKDNALCQLGKHLGLFTDKGQFTNSGFIDNHNNKIKTLGDIINNPVENRNQGDFEDKDNG